MSTQSHYDAVIVGTGQAGKPLAAALAAAGHKTAIVERKHVGGTCINEGCTPTKTMVASARAAHVARRSADYGVETGPVSVDMETVRGRKRDIVEKFRGGARRGLENTEGVDLLMGEARFTGDKTLEVSLDEGETRSLSADRVFINTGTRPSVPPVEGLDDVPFLDSTSIMELGEVPRRLLVLGGGYVGLEFAQMFRRFGSEVAVIQRDGQLLSREDPEIAEAVAQILREDGIEVMLSTEAHSVSHDGEGIQLTVSSPDGEQNLTGSHLLVATGRTPNTDALDPEAAGVQTDGRGIVQVNGGLETNVPGIYALGDVKGGPAFTHISYDDSRILAANLFDGGEASTDGRIVPYTVYIDPQLGRVGMTEGEARQQGYDVEVAKMPMSHVARALETDETRGLMKAVVEAGTGRILGCAVLGIEGGELMSMLHIAMLGGMPYTVLRDAPLAHPTLAESFNNLFARLG